MAVALHVQQRHLHHHRPEQFRVLGQHVAGEQATVAAALDAQVRRRGHLARDQVAGHRGEILVGAVAVGLERGLVPARAVLAAASDVGHHVHTALLQPAHAHATRISRGQRDLEAAIAVQQGRVAAVVGDVPGTHHEVGHAGAVLGGGEVLLDHAAFGVEERRHGLEHLDRLR